MKEGKGETDGSPYSSISFNFLDFWGELGVRSASRESTMKLLLIAACFDLLDAGIESLIEGDASV